MTVPRLIEISDYWSVVPPLHEAVASFLGMMNTNRRTVSGAPSADDPEQSDNLMKDLMAAGFQIPADILPGSSG